MGEILALTWAQWRTNLSYRVRMAYTLVGVVVSVVPLFFVAGAVQPVMADAIAAAGGQAFGFLLVGLAGVGGHDQVGEVAHGPSVAEWGAERWRH